MAPSPASLPAADAAGDARGAGRSALLELKASGQRYRFLDAAYRYLSAVEDDPAVAIEVLKDLVELGLGGPARELLRQRRDLARTGGPALRRSLAPVPSGRLPWESLQEVFAANLALLASRQPHLGVDESLLRRSLEGFRLFRSRDGRLHLCRREPGRLCTWFPCLGDHSAVESSIPDAEQLRRPVLIVGVHLNAMIDAVHARTEARTPLFIAETQWHLLAAWLHAAPRDSVLADPRVHLFGGPDAPEAYRRHLAEHADLEIPGFRLGCYAPDALCRRFDDAGREAHRDRERQYLEVTERLGARAARRHGAGRVERLATGARVLGFASRFTTMIQHSLRDIGSALEDLGHEFRLATERCDHCTSNTLVAARQIEAFDPDLIVLANHFRHEMAEPMTGVPVLTWVQDPTETVLSRLTAASIGPLDFQAGFYRDRCVNELGYPAGQYLAVGFFPVNDVKFHDGPLPGAARERYACDVAYVGHYQGTPAEYAAQVRGVSAAPLRPVIDAVERAIAERSGPLDREEAAGVVEAAASAAGLRLAESLHTNFVNFLAYRLFDIQFRLQSLGWVADWAERTGRRFLLHGTGWERHPRLRRFAAGPVQHGEEARRAYRGATVTIQTTPSGLTHQRTFEALLSGSLVLGRWCPADFDGLEPAAFRAARGDGAATDLQLYRCGFRGLDRIVFDGPEALEERLERAVRDAPWREGIVTEMRGVVAEHFTYRTVVPRVMDFVRRGLRRGRGGAGPDSGDSSKRPAKAGR